MDALDLPPPRKKRFTFKSYEQSLKSVHLPSSTAPTAFDEDLGDNASHFHERLGQLQELSLAPAFVKFAEPANRLAESMPLLLHNWRQIVQLWTDCVREAAATKDRGEAVKPLLELMKALLHDLRSTLSPMYPAILNELGPLLLRKLEPLALTELLATLVTFFRYILIPLLPNTTLLSATWKQLQRPFVEGDDQGRRMLGEVWGATLRRMKADQRDACIRMMMESLKENPQLRDGIAWVIVEACQAPSRSLHGCAPGVISTLVQIHLVADEEAFPESTTLLRRALTSLLHHSSGPPAFHPISLVLIDSFKSQVVAFEASSLESDLERLSRVMSLIETPCIVRKGARIPQEHLGSILSILGNLKASTFTAVQNRYVSLLISALTGAELSVWMGPGRKTVERIWENPAVGLRVAGGLADSDWDGWNAIVQPGVLKHLPTLLRDSSHVHEIALGFLSTPAVVARLRVANDAWLSDLQDWVKSSLQSWAYTLSHAILLTSILPLVPSLLRSSVSPELVKIIEKLLALQDIAQHHITSFPPSILLAQSLKAVGRSGFEHVEDGTLVSWTNQILSSSDWCQSPDVVSALVELCEARPDTIFGSVTSPKMVTEALEPLVLSYDRSLRLGALRVMSIHRETIDATAGAGTSSQVPRSTIARTILELCLDAENVSLDVAGVRERIVKINRVGSAAASSDSTSDNDAIHLAVRWLLAQLQVNLRPLWAPAQQSLANVMERHPAATWDLVFSELKRSALQISSSKSEETVQEAPLAQLVAVDGVNDVDDAIDGLEVEQEQEKTWRCPNANRRRVLIKHWFEPLEHVARSRIRSLQHSPDRLDVRTYEVELLGSLSRSPAIPEKRSRELVPFFLSLVPSTLPRRRLKAYFGLLSKFVNPKALHSTSTLYDIYQTMLSKPDRELQEAALSCILTYRSPALKRHEEQLRALLDETKWRDELSMLDIGSIETAHRSDVLPVLTGLLYGLIGERKRRHSGPDRRAAVLQALCNLHSDELVTFINLMLAPFPPSASDPITNDIYEFRGVGNATTTQQAGFLNLLGDVLKIMGSKSFAFWPKLMALTVEIIHSAQVGIVTANDVSPGDGDSETRLQEDGEPVESPDADEDVDVDEGSSRPSSRAYRSLRQAALKRIVGFFQISHDAIDYAPYIRLAFPTVITPRLATLPVENTQGPSALLDLFTEWASASSTAIFLVEHDDHLLPRVFECLNGVKVKPSVIMKVFDLVDHLLSLTPDHESLVQRVLAPHIPKLLRELSFMFQRLIKAGLRADPITHRMIDILSSLSEHMKDADDARRLAELILPLFKRPARIVPEKSKTNLLRVVRHLMPLVPDYARSDSGPFNKCFDALTALFQSLKARTARQELAAAFETLMSADPSFEQVSIIVGSLNAYSLRRVDEPDFNKRLAAFAQLNDSLHAALDTRGWKVVIHNMMFFILDPEEVALRSSAAESLRLFIRAVHTEALSEAAAQQHDLRDLFDRILYTSLRFALRSKSEQVRSDVLGVIAFAIDNLDSHRALQEMRPLLADGDAEANFFNNIYHIQLHRRTRALRRLADFVTSSTIRQSTVADLFVPIIEHFIAGVESLDHHLVNEAITTLGALADKLSWSAYYALHQRHLASAKQKTGTQKIRVRALVAILDHFTFKMSDIVDSAEPHDLDDTEGGDEVPMQPEQLAQRTLQAKIADVVTQRLLPSLLDFMEQRDDTEDIVRLPVAVGVANVAQHLSEASRHSQLGKLIVILSQALRSKSQETRDVVRDTIGKIALMLGPAMLPEILKQMRAALLRGPQLHVLAFVSHSLLVLVTSPEHAERFKNLDSSVADISHIAAEVVFGQSGRDVMSEDFRTKVREVRGSATRGLDTFALIARHVSPSKISALLGPVRAIMHETEASKTIQQIDDVLRRIASGLNANEHLSVADMLVLCHTLISQNAKFLQEDPRQHSKKRKKADVDVQIKRVQSEANDDIYANNSYRFVTLGLDLFITAYRRGRFDYKEASVLSRLEGMVSAIGNTLYSTNSAVVSLGVRAASSIAHCPLKSLSKSLPVYVKRIFSIIRQAGSTDSEMIQHTFKSLAIIIRDCPEAKVQDEDLTFLLEIIVPDIEEKDRQIAVFALLRAIVARKFVVPEIYDVMEKVAEIMVTNQSMQVQELCRGVLLQFLLDYPQGKGRLRTQMSFLAKNLSYVFESGRLSVLELLGAIIAKFDGALLHEYNELLSVALFMVLANDDSTKCRELAAELTKSLYSRSEDAARQEMMTRLHLWASKGSSSTLRRTVAQVYGIIVEGHGDLAAVVLSDLDSLTESSASILREVQSSLEDDNEDAFAEHDESQLDWQLAYHALTAMARVLKAKPDAVRNPKLVHWDAIAAHLIFPHAWVRLATARLIGTLCGGYPPSPPPPDLPDSHPLSRHGIIDLAHKLCAQLRSPHLDDALSLQVVKNLFYVGKCFSVWPESRSATASESQADANADVEEYASDEEEIEEETKGDVGAEGPVGKSNAAENPMRWLFSRLSYQARSAHIARRNRKVSSEIPWVIQPLSVLKWFAAMVNHLPKEDVARFLTHILAPVYRIIEDDTIRDPQMVDLRNTAQELQTLVQDKVGTTLFANEYSRIRQGVLDVRRERRTARVVQITTAPEFAAKRKIQRNANKKASRKRKHQEFTKEKIKLGLKRARYE